MKKVSIEDHHTLRLWIYDNIKSLVERSEKYILEAIHDEKFNKIPLDSHITGEKGNLFYVLKVL